MKRVAHGVSQGFNGTIFAYGQTGSGKTYTMGGATATLSAAPAADTPAGGGGGGVTTPSGGHAGATASPCHAGSAGSAGALPLPAPSPSSPFAGAPEATPTNSAPVPASPLPLGSSSSVSPATLLMPPPPPPPLPPGEPGRGLHPIGTMPSSHAAGAVSPATASSGSGSGSGGDCCLGPEVGVIPRAVSTLLADAEARRAQGWEFALTATYVEIYNEKIRDLLNPANDNLQVCRSSSSLGVGFLFLLFDVLFGDATRLFSVSFFFFFFCL